MKRILIAVTLLVLAVSAVLTISTAGAADVAGFHKTWEQARKAAVAEGKPIYLHFTTTWCGWCRKIESGTYASDVGAAALKGFVAASLDCTDKDDPSARSNRELMRKFGGQGYPFLVMLTPDQEVLGTISGYVAPEPFAASLGKAKSLFDQLAAFKAFASTADVEGYEYNLKAMALYEKVNRVDQAAAAARRLRKLDPANKKGHAATAQFALLTEAVHSPKAALSGERVDELVAQVKLFDPTNAQGVLQKALVIQVETGLKRVDKVAGPAGRAALLDSLAARLTELGAVGKSVSEAQLLWAYLGQANARVGRKDQALAALTQSVATNPDSPIVPKIKEFMAEIKEKM